MLGRAWFGALTPQSKHPHEPSTVAGFERKRMAKVEPAEQQRPLKNNPACGRCGLAKSSGTVCCASRGPRGADILLVGEALGANEEEHGRPFVGDAGRKLNYCLHRAGLERKQLRIANAVRCRPPGNRKPSKKELTACHPYLLHDILKQRPKVIVALGATAGEVLFEGPKRKVEKWRGFPIQQTWRWESPKTGQVFEHTCWLVQAYHPSACLHDWTLDDMLVHDLALAREYAAGNEVLTLPTTHVTVARTFDQAISLLRRLRKVGAFVLDLETTGRRPHVDKILCIGFCYRAGEAHVLPLLQQHCKPMWTAGERAAILAELTEVLEHVTLYGQNIKFDVKFLRKLTGIVDFRVGFDTMNAHHCIDENKRNNLTFMCQWYLRWNKYDAAMEPYQKSDDEEHGCNYAAAPNEVLWRYCGIDVDGTWQLRRKFLPLLKREKTEKAFHTEIGLINALSDVEFRGMHADRPLMLSLAAQYRKEQQTTVRALQRTATRLLGPEFGQQFNPNSPKQLTAVLLKAGARLGRKTKGGAVSVNKTVMAQLALKPNTTAGRIAVRMVRMRQLVKYVSTYLDGKDGKGGFLAYVEEHDRVHASYNVSVARTGRLSANDPPVQTVPRKGDLRTMFKPDNPQRDVFLSVDYSKIELCVMSWLANDHVMVKELLSGLDLHTRMAVTARLMRDPTPEEWERMAPLIAEDERAVAKATNFGIPYGRGAGSIVDANPDAFPPTMLKPQRVRRVQRVIDAYFDKYEGVRDYMERQVERATKTGRLRTVTTGRARRLTGTDWFNSKWGRDTEHRDLDFSHLEREAQNFQVQSIASDELSRATKRAYEGIKQSSIPCFRIVLTLHDQLLFNVPRVHADEASQLVRGWMETVLPRSKQRKYEMPLKVDVKVQSAWGQLVSGKSEY